MNFMIQLRLKILHIQRGGEDMAVGGQYTVQLRAILDTKGVLAQIAQIQKQADKIMIGGTGATKGASGIAAVTAPN